jgi:hypothetical protein
MAIDKKVNQDDPEFVKPKIQTDDRFSLVTQEFEFDGEAAKPISETEQKNTVIQQNVPKTVDDPKKDVQKCSLL